MCSSPAYTPAAFTTVFARISPSPVVTAQQSPSRLRPVTLVSKRNSTPFLAALSPSPRVSSKGQTMPEVFASSAPQTSPVRFGSISRASSPVRRDSPSTPFSIPRS